MYTKELNQILHRHQLTGDDKRLINEIFNHFQSAITPHPENPTIKKAGSQAKGLTIHNKLYLDILCAIPQKSRLSVHDLVCNMMRRTTDTNWKGVIRLAKNRNEDGWII